MNPILSGTVLVLPLVTTTTIENGDMITTTTIENGNMITTVIVIVLVIVLVVATPTILIIRPDPMARDNGITMYSERRR